MKDFLCHSRKEHGICVHYTVCMCHPVCKCLLFLLLYACFIISTILFFFNSPMSKTELPCMIHEHSVNSSVFAFYNSINIF